MDSNAQSFIIKFWLEQATPSENNSNLWHGQITHVPSGARRTLQNVDDLLKFIEPYLDAMGIQFTRQRRFWR
jgi:hypothetical protein